MFSFVNVYRKPGVEAEGNEIEKITKRMRQELRKEIQNFQMEYCFNIEYNSELIQGGDMEKILWLLTETFEPEFLRQDCPFLTVQNDMYSQFLSTFRSILLFYHSSCVSF